MAERGRPSKILDDSVTQRLCEALSRGNTLRCACQLAGIDWETLRRWRKLALSGSEIHSAFYARVKDSEASAEDGAVQRVRRGEPGWQGAAWWLERRKRWTWRRPANPDAANDKGDALEQLSDDELVAKIEAFQKRTGTK